MTPEVKTKKLELSLSCEALNSRKNGLVGKARFHRTYLIQPHCRINAAVVVFSCFKVLVQKRTTATATTTTV